MRHARRRDVSGLDRPPRNHFRKFALETFITWVLETLKLPTLGLPAVFIIALISATLLPLGSEPAVFGYVKLAPDMFWPAILVATVGNTIGGMIDWWMGHEARKAYIGYRRKHRLAGGKDEDLVHKHKHKLGDRWHIWMRRVGPPMLIMSWLPGFGDPLCTLAGWVRLPWKQCMLWMTAGKFVRYVVMTWALLYVPDSFWQGVGFWIKKLIV